MSAARENSGERKIRFPRRLHVDTEMLIGESFVAGTEAGERILNPKTGGDDPRPSRSLAAAGRRGRHRRRERLREMVADDAGRALRPAPQARRRDRARRRGFRDPRGAELRQAAHSRPARRDPGDRRLLPLLRRRRADDARRGGRRISAGPHLDDPPRSDRRRRLDRAVELSADDGGVEARAGARRRQHGRPQALRADAADHAEAGAARSPRSFPKASSTSSSGAARPSATR